MSHRDRGARRGARLRPGAARAVRRGGRRGSRSSSTPACGSSRRCARCARSCALWDELTRERYGVTDAKAAAVPLRRAGQLARPDRGAAREQRAAHRAGDARRSRSPRTPGPGPCSCRPGTRRSACRGRGTSSGRCGCSRCWPSSPTCWSTRTSSRARTSSRRKVDRAAAPRPGPRWPAIAGDGRRGGRRRERLPEVRAGRLALAAPGPGRVRRGRWSSASTRFTETEPNPLTADLDDRHPDASTRPSRAERVAALQAWRAGRDAAAVEAALAALRDAAKTDRRT